MNMKKILLISAVAAPAIFAATAYQNQVGFMPTLHLWWQWVRRWLTARGVARAQYIVSLA